MANNLTHFDPFAELARFAPLRGVDDLFRDLRFKHVLRDFEIQPLIKLDITEVDDAYHVKAEIPGVQKDDIKIDIEGNRVSISAETKREIDDKDGKSVVCNERFVGQQYRTFTLEHEIDDEHADAVYQDGVLALTLPKKSSAGRKKIAVK